MGGVARPAGLEPATCGLEGRCSSVELRAHGHEILPRNLSRVKTHVTLLAEVRARRIWVCINCQIDWRE